MFTTDQYELLDFGHGRKLERLGTVVVDRPAPAATGIAAEGRALWKTADVRFTRDEHRQGRWAHRGPRAESWSVRHGQLALALRLTDSGAVGVFPEQAPNWDWLDRQVRRSRRRLKVLNLFAYTGGSTLTVARAGADVVHVDAAKSAVQWARENAKLSRLENAPIRWIVEDAVKFVQRELRRGNHYDAVILDPPTYGHGPGGEAWKVDQHLYGLLRDCAALTVKRRAFLLLTCHSPQLGPAEMQAMLADTVFGHCGSSVWARRLVLRTSDGRKLPSGTVARWPGKHR